MAAWFLSAHVNGAAISALTASLLPSLGPCSLHRYLLECFSHWSVIDASQSCAGAAAYHLESGLRFYID